MPRFTLEDYEELNRSSRTREVVRALLPELTAIVEFAILADARGSDEDKRNINKLYNALRGPGGIPISIATFVPEAKSNTPREIAISMLYKCNPNISPSTIRNYASTSLIDTLAPKMHDRSASYHRPTRSAEFYLGGPKYRTEEVLNSWYSGMTCEKIAARLGFDKNLVGRMIHSLCPHTSLRRGRQPHTDYLNYPGVCADEVVLQFERHTSSEIAERLLTTRSIVLKILHRKRPGISMKKHGRRPRTNYACYSGLDVGDIVCQIHHGSSLGQVAASVGKSVETIRTIHHAVCKGECPRKRKRAKKNLI